MRVSWSGGRVARRRSAKPYTAVRIRSRPLTISSVMAVTRLKRKDRKNKVVAKQDLANIKLMTNLEAGSRSVESPNSQVVKNREVLAEIEAELKK